MMSDVRVLPDHDRAVENRIDRQVLLASRQPCSEIVGAAQGSRPERNPMDDGLQGFTLSALQNRHPFIHWWRWQTPVQSPFLKELTAVLGGRHKMLAVTEAISGKLLTSVCLFHQF
jgi:hypothetical protein